MQKCYLFLLLITLSFGVYAQCYSPQTLTSRMSDADFAVVGRVVESEPFYNVYGEIYTRHKLMVDQMGNDDPATQVNPGELYFFTMGGRINEEQTIVYPSLRDIYDADGLFLLSYYEGDRVVPAAGEILLRPTAVHESYLPYDAETGNFSDGGVVIGNLNQVNRLVMENTGQGLLPVSDRDFAARPAYGRSMMPTIQSISPLSVNAGVGDEILISGSGFGAQPGSVFFDSPDDGPGGSYTGAGVDDILSWSDTQVRVRVISNAGSGRVIVATSAGAQTTSNQQINIDYAITNLNLSSGALVTPLLIDDEADGNGGYSFAVSNSTANGGVSLAGTPAAFGALQRAVATWQNDGDFSIYLAGTTALQQPSPDDGTNIISFGSNAYDFDRELGNGTVGIAFSYYNACGSSEFEVSGADVLFRRNGNPNGSGGSVNYNYGPGGGGGTDFESVALHELGHVHQLKHVSDAGEVMSFRITNGASQRQLSTDTRAGADYVAQLSLAYDPPIINCGGDFNQERDYLTFSLASGGLLPVVWESFSAVNVEKRVRLNWRTTTERDNAAFAIQRSANGRDFVVIGEAAAASNGDVANDYEFYDDRPISGVSYYRIAQVDFSGSTSFTEIRELQRDAAPELSAYPNPVTDILTIALPAATQGNVLIIDALGRLMKQVPVNGLEQLRIPVQDLPAGQYVLRTENGQTFRFIR